MPSLKAQHNGVTDSSSAYIFTHTEQNAQNLNSVKILRADSIFLTSQHFQNRLFTLVLIAFEELQVKDALESQAKIGTKHNVNYEICRKGYVVQYL